MFYAMHGAWHSVFYIKKSLKEQRMKSKENEFQNKVDSLELPKVKYPTSGERL